MIRTCPSSQTQFPLGHVSDVSWHYFVEFPRFRLCGCGPSPYLHFLALPLLVDRRVTRSSVSCRSAVCCPRQQLPDQGAGDPGFLRVWPADGRDRCGDGPSRADGRWQPRLRWWRRCSQDCSRSDFSQHLTPGGACHSGGGAARTVGDGGAECAGATAVAGLRLDQRDDHESTQLAIDVTQTAHAWCNCKRDPTDASAIRRYAQGIGRLSRLLPILSAFWQEATGDGLSGAGLICLLLAIGILAALAIGAAWRPQGLAVGVAS